MATSSYASTEETTNACRACRLLLGPCTDELRDVLRHYVPPSTFPHVIKIKRSNLPRLTAPQMNLILPRGSSYTGNYGDMDISLLYILLRNICGIPPHSNGWGYDPDPTDRSLSANIERIRIARNQCVHSSSPVLSNADFNIIWSTVRSAVVDLDSFLNNGNKFEREVDFLRHETMDLVRDRHYIEELRKQAEEDALIREMVQALKRKLEQTETDRIENHNRIQKIVDAVNIHPETFMAYMKNGKTTVRHARGIVVGCAGAGKTTLLYRLMGKSLDEIKEIKSTRGLHVYEHIFSVKNGDLTGLLADMAGRLGMLTPRYLISSLEFRPVYISVTATDDEFLRKPLIRIPASEIQQKGSSPNDDSVNVEMGIETENSSSLENNKVDQSTGKELNVRQNTEPGSQKNEPDDLQPTENKRRKMHAGENDGIDEQLARDVMKKILDAKENEISVSMIDFAGQFAYYACHQIYMRSEAFYVLVLDMSKDFENFVCCERDECRGSIFSTWTYKDYLDFWLDSIKSFSGPSAQVFAVATHTEGRTGEEIDSFWETLWTIITEDDKTRLYDRDFALGLIEMNEEAKHVLQSLKKSISEVVSQGMDTKIEVPSAWALLEHLLQKTEKPILSISDINRENMKLPEEYQLKNQEELIDFLSFFHGHGFLLFFKEEGLKTHAVLGIQWFSNAFSKLIADKEHINRECKRRYIEDWNRFNATGNLSNLLVDALWKEESSFIEHKTLLMSYMERLRMLVSIKGKFSWYVPCMNQKPFTHDVFKQTMEKSSILCFRFTSFAMFVYYRLIAYCMSFLKWKVQLDKDKSQCLYHSAAIFETENHTVIVGIIDNDIQVQVLRINDPQLKVSWKTGKSIQTALTELTATFNEKKTFQKGYKCLNLFCSEKDQTFIPEDEISGSQCNCPIGRGKHKIDVQWTLGFWKDIDKGLPTQGDKAQGSTTGDDKTLRRGRKRKRKKEKTVVSINVKNITTTSGMVTFGNCDNTSVKQNQGSSAKRKKYKRTT